MDLHESPPQPPNSPCKDQGWGQELRWPFYISKTQDHYSQMQQKQMYYQDGHPDHLQWSLPKPPHRHHPPAQQVPHTQDTLPRTCDRRPPVSGGNNYEWRYDEGLSARMGVKKIPLILNQPGTDGNFLFRNPPSAIDSPMRTKREELKPWWPPVHVEPVICAKPPAQPRYIGLHCDPSHCPPNEKILRNF